MNVDKSLFRWDGYSDQPATIDKRDKRRLRLLGVRDEPRKWFVSLSLPRFLLSRKLFAKRFEAYRNDHRIGLCINLERPFEGKQILSGPEIAEIVRPLESAPHRRPHPAVRHRPTGRLRPLHQAFLRSTKSSG